MMKRYSYQRMIQRADEHGPDFDDRLNELGARGWRVVGWYFENGYRLLLEREEPMAADPDRRER